MAVAPKQNALHILRNLIPLNTLGKEDLRALLDKISFEKLKKGATVFRKGDTDNENVYLLSGKVAMYADRREVDEVQAGSDTARFPLAHQIPRKFTVVTRSRSELARVDNRLLGELLDNAGKAVPQEQKPEAAETDDWRSQLIRLRVFQQLPPASIHSVMTRMQKVEFEAGESVVKQGEAGDYFYLISKGRCSVTRSLAGELETQEVAQIGAGASFGEEALLSETPRTCSVSMLTDGMLLKLKREDFIKYVKAPLFREIDFKRATAEVEQGAIWLDVRSQEVFDSWHVPGAINLPLASLRYQSSSLDHDNAYIVYCDNGLQSATATYLLMEQGFHVSMLAEGIAAVDPQKSGMVKNEESAEIIKLRPEQEGEAEVSDDNEEETATPEATPENEQSKQLQAQLDEATRRAEQRLKQLKELKQALTKSSARLVSTESALDANKQENRRLAEEVGNLKEALQDKEAELENLVVELTGQLETANSGRASAESKLLELEKQQSSLEKQLQVAEEKQSELEQRLSDAGNQHREELKQSTLEREQLEQKLEEGEARTQELCQRIETLQADNDQAQTAFSEAREQIETLETNLAEMEVERETLEQRLAEQQTKQEALRDQRQELEAQLAEQQNQREALEQQLQGGEEKSEALSGQLETLQQEKADAETALSEAKGQIEALEQELQTQQTQWNELNEQRERLEAQLAEQQNQQEALEQQLQGGEEKNDALSGQLETLRQEKADADTALSDASARLEGLQQEKAEADGALAGANEQIEQIGSQLVAETGRREELERQLGEQQAQQEELRQQLESDQRQRSQLDEQLQQIESEKNKVEVTLADAEQRINDLCSQLEARDSSGNEVEQRLVSLQAERSELSRDLQHLRHEKLQADSALSDAREKLVDLESQLADSGSRHSELTAQLSDSLEQKESLEQALADAQQRHDELLEQNKAMQAEQADGQTAVSDARAKIAELESLLAERDASDAAQAERQQQALQQQLADQKEEMAAQRGDLDRQLANLKADKAMAEEAFSDATQQISELEAQITGLRQRLEAAEQQQQAHAQGAEEGEDSEALREQLNEAVAARLEAEADVRRQADLLDSIKSAGGDSRALQAEVQTLTSALEESDRAYDEAVNRVRRLENERLLQDQEMERLEDEVRSLKAAGGDRDAQASVVMDQLRREKSEAEANARRLDGEVQELRAVMAQYVEQIEADQQAGGDEIEALRAELQLVRERSDEDLARMRQELANTQAGEQSDDQQQVEALKSELEQLRLQVKEHQLSGSAELAENQALKEEAEERHRALQDKQAALEQSQADFKALQAQYDSDKREVERAKQALETARMEAEEADFRRQEAEQARQQVQDALYQAQQEMENNRAKGASQEGFPKATALPMEQAPRSGGGRKLALGLVFGALLAFAVADGLSIMSGKGELVSGLLEDYAERQDTGATGKTVDRTVASKPGTAKVGRFDGLSRSSSRESRKPVEAKRAITSTSSDKPAAGRIIRDRLRDGSLGPQMILLKGAGFTMGSEADPLEREEGPAHQVTLKDFAIGRFEVTFDQYLAFVEDTGRAVPEDQGWGRGDRPVINVSWRDAKAYADWLSEQTGRRYRLPTESEWEYAARGGSDAYYWWGYKLGEGRANCFDCGSRWDGESTAPIGSFDANNFGIHDTAGNVMEWVEDCYYGSYEGVSGDGSARVRAGCQDRVVRGGAFDKPGDSMRTTKRAYRDERLRVFVLGFRLVREIN